MSAATLVFSVVLSLALFVALVVVTPGATERPARDPADTRVALPGAITDAGIEAVPDLGTALLVLGMAIGPALAVASGLHGIEHAALAAHGLGETAFDPLIRTREVIEFRRDAIRRLRRKTTCAVFRYGFLASSPLR